MSWNTNPQFILLYYLIRFCFLSLQPLWLFFSPSCVLINENGCGVGCCVIETADARARQWERRGVFVAIHECWKAANEPNELNRTCRKSLAHGGVLAFEEWPPLCECVFRSRQLGEIASLCQGTVSTFSLIPLHPLYIPPITISLSLPLHHLYHFLFIHSHYHVACV